MSFITVEFAVFLAVVLLVYHLLPHRRQNLFLLAASYVFYCSWSWWFPLVLLATTGVDYFCGIQIEQRPAGREKKRFLLISLGCNLASLSFFKYLNFFVDQAACLLARLGLGDGGPALHIIMPIGISFYTFQSLSYIIDVYRGQTRATRDFVEFALYVAFFPQLVAGPIERSSHLLPQVQKPRTVRRADVGLGAHLIFWGLFQKLYLADHLALVAQQIFGNAGASGGSCWVGVYAVAIRVFCDISGYTDIARGVARWMGFELVPNFRLPYFAPNLSEFWRRWHMSVTLWFRDYLMFPLLVRTRGRAALSAFLTLIGISVWHTLSYASIARGMYLGGTLVAYQLFRRHWRKPAGWPGTPAFRGVVRVLSALLTFHAVCVGWLFFELADVGAVCRVLAAMVTDFRIGDWWVALCPLARDVWVFVFMQAVQAFYDDEFAFLRLNLVLRLLLYWVMLWGLIGTGAGLNEPFIYFKF